MRDVGFTMAGEKLVNLVKGQGRESGEEAREGVILQFRGGNEASFVTVLCFLNIQQ